MDDQIKLRNVQAEVIEGADAEALATALNAFFESAADKVLVGVYQAGDLKVLIIFAE